MLRACACAAALVFVSSLAAAEPATSGAALLEKYKSLAGDWIALTDHIHGQSGESVKGKIVASYRVTAGGSAVFETLFPGTPMEMISVYHLDGADLVMTHYCMAKNQPHFRAKAGQKEGVVHFEFIGGSNIDLAKDFHISSGRVEFVSKDKLISEWCACAAGKKAEEFKLELGRKK